MQTAHDAVEHVTIVNMTGYSARTQVARPALLSANHGCCESIEKISNGCARKPKGRWERPSGENHPGRLFDCNTFAHAFFLFQSMYLSCVSYPLASEQQPGRSRSTISHKRKHSQAISRMRCSVWPKLPVEVVHHARVCLSSFQEASSSSRAACAAGVPSVRRCSQVPSEMFR